MYESNKSCNMWYNIVSRDHFISDTTTSHSQWEKIHEEYLSVYD